MKELGLLSVFKRKKKSDAKVPSAPAMPSEAKKPLEAPPLPTNDLSDMPMPPGASAPQSDAPPMPGAAPMPSPTAPAPNTDMPPSPNTPFQGPAAPPQGGFPAMPEFPTFGEPAPKPPQGMPQPSIPSAMPQQQIPPMPKQQNAPSTALDGPLSIRHPQAPKAPTQPQGMPQPSMPSAMPQQPQMPSMQAQMQQMDPAPSKGMIPSPPSGQADPFLTSSTPNFKFYQSAEPQQDADLDVTPPTTEELQKELFAMPSRHKAQHPELYAHDEEGEETQEEIEPVRQQGRKAKLFIPITAMFDVDAQLENLDEDLVLAKDTSFRLADLNQQELDVMERWHVVQDAIEMRVAEIDKVLFKA